MPALDADLVVLGGGPAGLGAAWWAARAGHRVLLLERGERWGGAAASIEVAGVRVDLGSHRLHPSVDPAILADLRGLLGEDLQVRPRNGRIRLEDRWLAFPLRTGDLLRAMPRSFAARAAWDAATGWARRQREDSFAEVVRAGLGPTMAERFYGPYARKIWGLDPAQLSGEQARRRIAADSPAKLLARLLRSGQGERPWFWYPRHGFGQIAEALAAGAREAGADLRLGASATRVATDAAGVTVETDGASVRAGQVWSTVPLPLLARLAGAPADVLKAAAGLDTRAMLLVYLVLEQPSYTPYDAHYLPGPHTPVTRLSEPKRYRDSAEDPPGRTVLCAEVPCALGDELWAAGDDTLATLVVEGLTASGLPAPTPSAVHVERLPHAYPVYRRGYEAAFARLDDWVSAQPRLLSFGRQGLFAHDNTHHALAMARAAVAALGPGGQLDHGAWVRAREGFARHVVED